MTELRKIIAVILSVMIVVSMTVTVTSAKEINKATVGTEDTTDSTDSIANSAADTVYFKNSLNWTKVYCYMWNDSNGFEQSSGWPGNEMISFGSDIYGYKPSKAYEHIIFHNASNTSEGQTGDLDLPGLGYIYNIGSSSKTGTWSIFDSSELTTHDSSADAVYLKNSLNWSEVYCYMWNDSNGFEQSSDWPGNKMTNLGSGVFEYKPSKAYEHIIFNNASNTSESQTGDLDLPGLGYIYTIGSSSKIGTWSVFDSSIIFETSPTEPATQETEPTSSEVEASDNIEWYVVGDSGLCGGNWSYAPNPDCLMTNINGVYTVMIPNIKAGVYFFKVVELDVDNNYYPVRNHPGPAGEENSSVVTVKKDDSMVKITLVSQENPNDDRATATVYEPAENSDYTYVTDGIDAIITGYSGGAAVVEIPAIFDGCAVTAIESKAFENTNITKVVIPDTVTYIGKFAFCRCSNLEYVTLPSALTHIDYAAFASCSSLSTIVFPDGLKIVEESAFGACSSLKQAMLPDSLEELGKSAFFNCSSLENIRLSANLKEIKEYTFQSCSNLKQITIPEGIVAIGDFAFLYVESITDIEIPDGVTAVGKGAFSDCTSLKTIVIPKSITNLGNFVLNYCNNLTDIYYKGSIEDWNKIDFGEYGLEVYNYCNPEIHYNWSIVKEMIEEDVTPDTADSNIAVFGLASKKSFKGAELLGVQLKADGKSFRFMSVLSSEIIDNPDVLDYGYVFTTTDKDSTTAVVNANKLNVDNGHKFSCYGTYNTFTGNWGNADTDATSYKYVTAGINNVPVGKTIVARFYIATTDGTYYADYINSNNISYSGCAVNLNDFV